MFLLLILFCQRSTNYTRTEINISNSGDKQQKEVFTHNKVLDNIDFFTDNDRGPKISELCIFIFPRAE